MPRSRSNTEFYGESSTVEAMDFVSLLDYGINIYIEFQQPSEKTPT
jgi:hypothetical protein